jgi:diadenosine tetraphosphatase ApaH/serine/threonine PP2A family protein phosphatase
VSRHWPWSGQGRLYVVGDIHGCADLLDRMAARIADDLAARPAPESLVVTVGDYIDRGPDSAGVIERLMRNPFPTAYMALKGNHEVLLEDFLAVPATAAHWRRLGGIETLRSYGVAVDGVTAGTHYMEAARALAQAVPAAHRDFLASLGTSLTVGRHFICHAGVRPGVPLERQSEEDLLWIREPFLASRADFGRIVVHGHTPAPAPEALPNRINVDTGAFATGRLTCAAIDAEGVRFVVAT